MDDNQLSKQIWYSQLKEGNQEKDQKRFKDILKQNVKKCNLDINSCEFSSISGDPLLET